MLLLAAWLFTMARGGTLTLEPYVLSLPILNEGGEDVGMVHIKKGQEAADVAYRFASEHGLPHWFYEAIVQKLCTGTDVLCARDIQNPLLSSRKIRRKGQDVGTLQFFLSEAPSTTVSKFCTEHSLPNEYCRKLLGAVCEGEQLKSHCIKHGSPQGGGTEQQQSEPASTNQVLFSTPIATQTGELLGDLDISAGQEPADIVLDFCAEHRQSDAFCHAMIVQVCKAIQEQFQARSQLLSCSRPHALLFSRPITTSNGALIAHLTVRFGQHPLDVIQQWCQEYRQPAPFCAALQRSVCAEIDADYPPAPPARLSSRCDRPAVAASGPRLVFENEIERDGVSLGVVRVTSEDQVVDVVHHFCTQAGVRDFAFQAAMFNQLCAIAAVVDAGACVRQHAVLYQTAVATNSPHGVRDFEVRVGEEPADAAHRFCTSVQPRLSVSFCQQLLAMVCEELGVEKRNVYNCTRSKAKLFAQPLTGPGGAAQGSIDVFEGQEPTDIVYGYCKTKEMLPTHNLIMAQMCELMATRPPHVTQQIQALLVSARGGNDASARAEAGQDGRNEYSDAHLECTRLQPRDILFQFDVGFAGLNHVVQYPRPPHDFHAAQPSADNEFHCSSVHNGRGTECLKWTSTFAAEWCDRYIHGWGECPRQIEAALDRELAQYNARRRWKTNYEVLGLEANCDQIDVEIAYRRMAAKFTEERDPVKFSKVLSAYRQLSDPKQREYEDQPCVPIFGSLCGKRTPDGGLRVIMPSPGE